MECPPAGWTLWAGRDGAHPGIRWWLLTWRRGAVGATSPTRHTTAPPCPQPQLAPCAQDEGLGGEGHSDPLWSGRAPFGVGGSHTAAATALHLLCHPPRCLPTASCTAPHAWICKQVVQGTVAAVRWQPPCMGCTCATWLASRWGASTQRLPPCCLRTASRTALQAWLCRQAAWWWWQWWLAHCSCCHATCLLHPTLPSTAGHTAPWARLCGQAVWCSGSCCM